MHDDEAKLCWRLAGTRRHDWWNVRKEHTPFQWACQIARSIVEPWGDERADLRAAQNTTQIVVSNAWEKPDDDVIDAVFEGLRFYLKSNAPAEQILSPAQAAAAHR